MICGVFAISTPLVHLLPISFVNRCCRLFSCFPTRCLSLLYKHKIKSLLKTIVNRSEFSESNNNSCDHEHFVG